MEITVKEISPAAFIEEEKKIRDSHTSILEMQQSWKSLDNFFRNQSPLQDKKYWWTYFRIYVDLSWKLLTILDRSVVDSAFFARQVPMALLLDIDVMEKIIWYLRQDYLDKNAISASYIKLKSAFLESEEIVGEWQGQDVIFKDLTSEYILQQNRADDTMAEAEYINKLEQIMFPKEGTQYILVDPDRVVERFLDLIAFFETFTQENIWNAIDAIVNPEKYQNTSGGKASGAYDNPITSQLKPALQTQAAPAKGFVAPISVKSPIVQISPVESQERFTVGQVKSQIEARFKKDTEGNFIDLEGVMAKLSELADKYNDPKIAEMIYFDEQENKFKWNI